MRRSTIKKKQFRHSRPKKNVTLRKDVLEAERGSYLKKWTGRKPVALLYPNTYKVGMSSLGYQLVYNLLNEQEDLVCERFFLPEVGESFLSIESGRPLSDFPLIYISMSFEHDYINLARILVASGIEPLAEKRDAEIVGGSPLVVCGGVVSFMNPEPIADFIDMFYVGEAETALEAVTREFLLGMASGNTREDLLYRVNKDFPGCYAPRFYTPDYNNETGRQSGYQVREGLPKRVMKQTLAKSEKAAHSQLLTKEAEFADLYLTELGRGCSRGCRFCTAGFIYRPPRLWDADAVVAGLAERFDGVERVGLLGMEMAASGDLDIIADYLLSSGCSLSFSSLRADRLSSDLIDLLSKSNLKSVAIAPDGSSERLRYVINKGLREDDLLNAAENLVGAGIFKLKLYLMVGLPTETEEDLEEAIALVGKIKERIEPIGKARGRLSEIVISVNSFAPKPWTPFQYHAFGESRALKGGESIPAKRAIKTLKERIAYLKKGFSQYSNVSMNNDKPEHVLFQAVLSRADRRVAQVLLSMARHGLSWKQAMKTHNLTAEEYATTGYDGTSFLPWSVIDHGIEQEYLWQEYQKSFSASETTACNPEICTRCGVCGDSKAS